MAKSPWTLKISAKAEHDLNATLRWTAKNFGSAQARVYYETLRSAIISLADDPEPIDSKLRDDLSPGVRILHVGRKGRRGSHVLIYRVLNTRKIVELSRILHDDMDLPRHIPPTKP
jgi:toxin ParE1/3/4